MTANAARTLVIGNWNAVGYSRYCWVKVASRCQSVPPDLTDVYSEPWHETERQLAYLQETEGPSGFLPIPVTAPDYSREQAFRQLVFKYFSHQNVTSVVLICDSAPTYRILELLGPLIARPVFVVVSSYNDLVPEGLRSLAAEYVFRLCPNNRQQADLVATYVRLCRLKAVYFWTGEQRYAPERRYHADDLYSSLRVSARLLGLTRGEWKVGHADYSGAALFVAGYGLTAAGLVEHRDEFAQFARVILSDGCSAQISARRLLDSPDFSAVKSDNRVVMVRSSTAPESIVDELIRYLDENAHLSASALRQTVSVSERLRDLPVSFASGFNNSTALFRVEEVQGNAASTD